MVRSGEYYLFETDSEEEDEEEEKKDEEQPKKSAFQVQFSFSCTGKMIFNIILMINWQVTGRTDSLSFPLSSPEIQLLHYLTLSDRAGNQTDALLLHSTRN